MIHTNLPGFYSFDEEKIWKVRVNHSLEPVETTYWCTVHKFPKFEKKHLMVAVSWIFTHLMSRDGI